MKDIQEIMMEMEKINEQVAAEIEGDNTVEVEEDNAIQSGVITESAGTYSDCNREVKLCATVVVPDFELDSPTNHDVKLIYNKGCLQAVVVPEDIDICGMGCGSDKVTIYKVKIVGSLPFAFSAVDAIKGDCGNRNNVNNVIMKADLCAHGSVCVDNVICCKTKRDDADELAAYFNCKLGKACAQDPIRLEGLVKYEKVACEKNHYPCNGCSPDVCRNETLVKFTATLKFDQCPSPVPSCS